jgi:hypothetical protein
MGHDLRSATLMAGVVLLAGCSSKGVLAPDGSVAGNWGGNNAALMADDTSAHVHIACTYGNVHHSIVPGADGKFDVTGEYNVRAYPVDAGVFHPAHFTGMIAGRLMSLTVTLSDTAATLGPVTLVFDQQANMGPCPICRSPAERARRAMLLRSLRKSPQKRP